MHEFLTTRETAALLRIKERKLYELCADGALPVTRVTGKLLFPRAALMAWLRAHTEYGRDMPSLRPHPKVFAGSHDPLLEWALRASGSGMAQFFDGSSDGLQRIAAGEAQGAGIHFHGAGHDGNIERVRDALAFQPVVVIAWARREQGLLFRKGETGAKGIEGLRGRRVVARQPGSGSRALFDAALAQAGVDPAAIALIAETARSETDVAQAVVAGHADAGLAVRAAAAQYGLDFTPIATECFDLVIWRRDYFDEPVQKLLAFCGTELFATRASELGGYDIAELGAVRFNGG